MKFHTTAPSAAKSRRQVNVHAQPYMISDYIGAAPRRGAYVAGNESNDNGLPQGFLVEQPAGASTQPHFHIHPQFQLVMDGGGMLGKHALGPLSLHYVNGFTPYGPIRAGNTGLLYFTLRRYWDPGAKYMPASREQLVKGNQRTRVGDVDPATTVRLPELTTTITTPVIEVEADGLAAWLIQAGPGMQLPSPPRIRGRQRMDVRRGDEGAHRKRNVPGGHRVGSTGGDGRGGPDGWGRAVIPNVEDCAVVPI